MLFGDKRKGSLLTISSLLCFLPGYEYFLLFLCHFGSDPRVLHGHALVSFDAIVQIHKFHRYSILLCLRKKLAKLTFRLALVQFFQDQIYCGEKGRLLDLVRIEHRVVSFDI